MNDLIYSKVCYVVFACAIAGLIGGCSGSTYSSYDDSRQQYDRYMDMPGYYDFRKPVVFLPTDSDFYTPVEEEIVETEESESDI